jgi:predicted MFS family arabinose efflux permease
VSTTLAGWVTDHFGSSTAFLVLAAIAATGLACIALLMPETRPADAPAPPERGGAAVAKT